MHSTSGWTERLAVGDEVYVHRPWQGSDADGYSIGTVSRVTPSRVTLDSGDAFIRGGNRYNESRSIGSALYRAHIYPKSAGNDRWLEALKARVSADADRRKLRERVIFAANRCTDDDALNRALTILGEHAG